MIPPLFMDIQSHHAILDCCAAPGSKSGQILEALHMAHPDNRPTGVFVANDADIKRCHMLVHQSLRRLGSPNMMVTNNDASLFPTLKRQSATGAGPPDNIMFDRILADVPCSGDGTMRKNLAIWQNWTLGNGLGLHSCVCSGSTCRCSRMFQLAAPHTKPLHPDAEAGRSIGVFDLLAESVRERSGCQRCPQQFHQYGPHFSPRLLTFPIDMSLVDVSDQIPALQRYPGKTTWKVLDTIFNEVEAPPAGEKAVLVDGRRMFASLWPTNTQDNKLERWYAVPCDPCRLME
jgi:multisite-specific tRNA:(cytosine-C5)-methyltransferase